MRWITSVHVFIENTINFGILSHAYRNFVLLSGRFSKGNIQKKVHIVCGAPVRNDSHKNLHFPIYLVENATYRASVNSEQCRYWPNDLAALNLHALELQHVLPRIFDHQTCETSSRTTAENIATRAQPCSVEQEHASMLGYGCRGPCSLCCKHRRRAQNVATIMYRRLYSSTCRCLRESNCALFNHRKSLSGLPCLFVLLMLKLHYGLHWHV